MVQNTDTCAKVHVEEHTLGDSKVYWMQRPNISQCFGGYSESVRYFQEHPYKYRFFINSTMRGPFLPVYTDNDVHWTKYFTKKFETNPEVALVGSTINTNPQIHVQSMMMVLDERALALFVHHGIFLSENKHVDKHNLVHDHEIRGTQIVLAANYNIDCMMTSCQRIDWRTKSDIPYDLKHDAWYIGQYYGSTLHPYETIFFKTNRSGMTNKTPVDVLSFFKNTGETHVDLPLHAKKELEKCNVLELKTADALEDVREAIHSVPFIPPTTAAKKQKPDMILLLSILCAVLGVSLAVTVVLLSKKNA
jgi:hypothetical protein